MSSEKKSFTKREKRIIGILAIAAILVLGVFAWMMYANDYYRAKETAKEAMQGNSAIEVTEKDGYYVFSTRVTSSFRGPEHGNGIIFYPGGKVEETAYAPMLLELANQGYEVYLVKMPAKLAVFGMNAAEDIIEDASHIKEWTMMGHSLGGAMAASFSANHDEEIDRLVLLAAYSTEDLTDKEIDVFSIYGTEDKVLNMEKYKEYRSNLPENTVEEVIEGANHANYAYYGAQEGDGEASITREEQQRRVLDVLNQ